MQRVICFFLALTMFVCAGCKKQEDGTFEKVGREVDDAVNDASEKEKSVGDKVGESIKDLGDKIEDKS